MDLNMIHEMVNSLGFPIAIVLYFIWDKNKTTTPLVEAINNNTIILTRLLDKIGCDKMADDLTNM